MDIDYVRRTNERNDRLGIFESYAINKIIGIGGSSKVYLVTKAETDYAMKVPLQVNLTDTKTSIIIPKNNEYDEKFKKEADNWILLSEQAPETVVRFLDYNVEPFPWMVMELADGDFKKAIDEKIATIEDIIDLLESLQKIHEIGVAHLDIKPENILKINGKWKFSDFGLSKIIGRASVTTDLKGTPEYMAPEQISRKYGSKGISTDIWQMGIMAYIVLTGESPYVAEDLAELSMEILTDGPDLEKLPTNYRNIISKALKKEQSSRYESCKQFAKALKNDNTGTKIEVIKDSHNNNARVETQASNKDDLEAMRIDDTIEIEEWGKNRTK